MHALTDPIATRNLRVLVADDDPLMLRLTSRWLEQAGYRVDVAGDGQEALQRIEADCPDLLVTDWEMPHLDGLELCRKVRQLQLPHYVYILFLTVKSAPEETVAGLEVGADDFLTKPVNQAELLARMRAGSRVVELERRLSEIARTDPLTGLMTRRSFFQTAEKHWTRAQHSGKPISCAMLDIDFFKRINDIHGHLFGDAVLKAMARTLLAGDAPRELVCRYGGEEFCVLLPESSDEEAARWAQHARERIATTPIDVGSKQVRITCSIGTAQNHGDTQSCEQLIDQADQALLCAKNSGRDRVVRFESLTDSSELQLGDGGKNSDLFQGIVARHVMTPLVVSLRENETIGQAAEFFLRSRINSTPVVDARGMLAGILSEKDLMAALVSLDCWHRPIREVMKPNVICYDEETPIRAIYEFLCRVSIRRVVVADAGRPTGTISRGTLLRWFRNLVFSKGLIDQEGMPSSTAEADPYRSRQRLAETSRELSEQVAELERCLIASRADLVPQVVGGATRMQELLDDLLAFSRYGGSDSETASLLDTLLLNTSHID